MDFYLSPRAVQSIRAVTLPAIALVGLVGIARATLMPDPSVWVQTGKPVSASALQQNLLDLNSRLTAVESVHPATYVGVTGGSYNGNLGGYAGATAQCAISFPGAHLCTAEEMVRTLSMGGTLNGLSGWAWYATGTGTGAGNGDCSGGNSYSSFNASTSNFQGAVWTACCGPGFATCNTSLPLACCK